MDRSAHLVLTLSLFFSLCLPALAADEVSETRRLEQEAQALTSSDIPPLRAKADAGDERSQYLLARAYEGGYGIPQDYAEAFKWYEKVPCCGNMYYLAMYKRGEAYYFGRGVEKDVAGDGFEETRYHKAYANFGPAAQAGHVPEAAFMAGESLLFGRYRGVVVGYGDEAATSYYRIAAALGDRRAQARLALLTPPCVNTSEGGFSLFFCSDLRAVLASRENNFEEIRGLKDLVCEHSSVQERVLTYFECNTYPYGDDRSPETFNQLVAKVKSSLPAGWNWEVETLDWQSAFWASPGPGPVDFWVLRITFVHHGAARGFLEFTVFAPRK